MNKKIAVIGLGYVGLPLAAAFSKKHTVLAYDNDSNRVGELNKGWDRIEQLAKADLIELQSRLTFSDDAESLSDCNTYIITVPTPVTSDKKPNLFFLMEASKTVGKFLKKEIQSFMKVPFIQDVLKRTVFQYWKKLQD